MPKTDEASPFALLVGAGAPVQKAANPAGGQKGDQNGDKGDDKAQPDNSAVDKAAPTQNTGAPQTAAVSGTGQAAAASDNDNGQDDISQPDPETAPAADVPPDLTTPDLTTLETAALPPAPAADDASSPDATISSQDTVALWPQSARPAPQAAQPKPAKADKDAKKDAGDQPAQPDAAAALAPDLSRPDLQTAATVVPAPPPAPVPTPDVAPEADALPAIASAAPPAAPLTAPTGPAAPPAAPAGPAVPQTTDQAAAQASQTDAAPPAGTQSDVDAAQDTDTEDQALQAAAAAKDLSKPVIAQSDAKSDAKSGAKSDTKTDAPKPAKAAASKPQQNNDPAAVKSADASNTDADEAVKPEASRPAAQQTDATAAKAAANAIAAPAAAQTGAPQAPTITQHIQVTAQPHETAANLPALAVEIAAKSLGGAKQFDIRLDPPELGRVEVRLSIDATGKASAHLSADQPQTLSLLQRDAPALTRALREAGLDVSQDGLNFSLRQQAHQDGGADARQGRGRGFALAATTSIEATSGSAAYSGPADGRLDIRV